MLDQSGVLLLLKDVMPPSTSHRALCQLLIHLDAVVAEDGRVTLNDLYTAATWWSLARPSRNTGKVKCKNLDEIPSKERGHIVEQLAKVLECAEGRALYARFCCTSSLGRISLPRLADLVHASCFCVRPRDLRHLTALLCPAGAPPGGLALDEVRLKLASCTALQSLYWRVRCLKTGERPPGGGRGGHRRGPPPLRPAETRGCRDSPGPPPGTRAYGGQVAMGHAPSRRRGLPTSGDPL
jgi:hypothetical protein